MTKTTDNNREGETLRLPGAAMTEPELDAWFVREVLPLEASLMQYLNRNWRDKTEVEDFCQEVYIKVYEAARTEAPKSVRPFVFAIARNLLINRMKRAQIVPIETAVDLEAMNLAADEPSAERAVIARDELRSVQAALEQLPRRCREAVTLRKIEGLSMREIATRMGVTLNTVNAHLVEGSALLADILYSDRPSHRRKA
jgi:RNA polymerase sigma-70 factor (ECF subfamily)